MRTLRRTLLLGYAVFALLFVVLPSQNRCKSCYDFVHFKQHVHNQCPRLSCAYFCCSCVADGAIAGGAVVAQATGPAILVAPLAACVAAKFSVCTIPSCFTCQTATASYIAVPSVPQAQEMQ